MTKLITSCVIKLELYQHDVALAMTIAIKGSSRKNHYQELGFETQAYNMWSESNWITTLHSTMISWWTGS